jgi:DNA polymerase/3'-5' exonuclease PolX
MVTFEAEAIAHRAIERLRLSFPDLGSIVASGRVRRMSQTTNQVVIAATSSLPNRWPARQFINQLVVDLIVSDADHFGIALLFSTGSSKHVQRLQGIRIFERHGTFRTRIVAWQRRNNLSG